MLEPKAIRARWAKATRGPWIDDGHESSWHWPGIPRTQLAENRCFIAHSWQDVGDLLDALEAAERELDEALRAVRSRPDYDLHCQRCGAPHWLDTVIPSEIWNQIARPEDILCLLCIDELLQQATLTAEAEFYYAGPAVKSRLYDGSYGDTEWWRQQARDLSAKVNALLTEIPGCRCHEDYKRIGKDDPGCPYHEIGAEVIEELRAAVQEG